MDLLGKYMVVWEGNAKGGEDLPLRAFDTTIESNAYITACVDIVEMFSKDEIDRVKLRKEFKVKEKD
tara:strand:+ start:1098 stop:1298 length:201 start_codon:yes stop_codon:yes gene_type:complete